MLRFNMSGHSGGSVGRGGGSPSGPSGRGGGGSRGGGGQKSEAATRSEMSAQAAAAAQAERDREILSKAFSMSTPGMLSRAAATIGPAVTGTIESLTGTKGTAPAKGPSTTNPASDTRGGRVVTPSPNLGAALEPAKDVTVPQESLLADEARRKTQAEEQARRGRTRTLLSGGGNVSDLSVGKTTLFGS